MTPKQTRWPELRGDTVMSEVEQKRKAILLFAWVWVILALFGSGGECRADARASGSYEGLLEALRTAERSTVFVPFTDFAHDPDSADHPACMEYLDRNPNLLEKIRDDLGCEEIQWQLKGIDYRLLYVPEDRPEVAGPFIEYSRAAISDLLARTGFADPYHSISTRMEQNGTLAEGERIRAVIVQDLAREYNARYHFSGTTEKEISIGLSGQSSINEVGSYSSYLHYDDTTGHYRFTRDRLTVWKTGADNPYTVLMTPLEETLHIVLRDSTEQAIRRALEQRGRPNDMGSIKEVVQQWLAVEEAVVGGVVHQLVPELILTRIPELPENLIQADLAVKNGYDKYRYLPRAIELVRTSGVSRVVEQYRRSPEDLNKLLNTTPEERVDRTVEQR